MIKTEILNPSLETIGEEIGQELGAKMIKDFQDHNPNENQWHFVGRNIIDQILAQPGCVGIRFYNGLNESGEQNLVYVGVDKNNEIISEFSTIGIEGKIEQHKGIVADRGTRGNGSTITTITTNSWF